MATNADEPETASPEDVSQDEVADLAAAKAEAQDKPQAEVSEDEAQSDQSLEAEEEAPAEPDATLTTEPTESTEPPAEADKDLAWYKKAYENSTSEALRLKGELDKKPTSDPPVQSPQTTEPSGSTETLDPDRLYLEHLRTKDINVVWSKVIGEYPQLADPKGDTYKKFVSRANVMGKTILEDEKRYVEPSELYPMVISSLGLNKGDDQDKLAAALKDGAAAPKVSSGKATPSKSKVTDAMIALNQKIYPGKSAAEIREELEAYVQA